MQPKYVLQTHIHSLHSGLRTYVGCRIKTEYNMKMRVQVTTIVQLQLLLYM